MWEKITCPDLVPLENTQFIHINSIQDNLLYSPALYHRILPTAQKKKRNPPQKTHPYTSHIYKYNPMTVLTATV